jgi:hypothetical protein
MKLCKEIIQFLYRKAIFFIKKIFYLKKDKINLNEDEINRYFKDIKKNGFLIVDNFIDKKNCDKIIDAIDCFKESNKNLIWKDVTNSEFRLFGAEKINKEIMNFFLNKTFIGLGSKCLGRKILNLMTMANRVEAKKNNLGSGGGWHRDDINFQFKAIIYLCDVDNNNGPFQLLENSNTFLSMIKDSIKSKFNILNTRIKNNNIALLDQKRVKTITGKAGTLILVDTSLIHRGKPLINGFRYALTNYYYPYYQVESMKNHFLPKI